MKDLYRRKKERGNSEERKILGEEKKDLCIKKNWWGGNRRKERKNNSRGRFRSVVLYRILDCNKEGGEINKKEFREKLRRILWKGEEFF